MNELGEYLRELRGNKSIREVSKDIGYSHTYLSTLEKGFDPRTKKPRKPTFEILNSLAKYYNVSTKTLMVKAGYTDLNSLESFLNILDPLKSFGDNLKLLRGEKTLEEVSRDTGIHIDLLKKMEDGLPKNQKPTLSNVIKLADYYNTHKGDLAFLAGYSQTDVLKELIGINVEIPEETETMMQEHKGKWKQATNEEIKQMAKEQRKALEGKEFNIEELLSDDFYIRYKGRLLAPEEKRKIMSLIEISFN